MKLTDRTLTEDDIAKLSVEEMQALFLEVEREEQAVKKRGRFNLFKPFAFQREWYECKKKIILLLAGNQVGKTTCGAIRTLTGCLGVPPPSLGGVIPVNWGNIDCSGKQFLAAGENFTSAIPKTILPKLNEFIVPEMLSRKPKRGTGTKLPEIFYFKSGAELHIMSYDQDPDSFEGAVWSGIWLDEPPPEKIFTALHRGAIRANTTILITATPIKEPWMYDALVAPLMDPDSEDHETTAVFRADIHDTCIDCHGEGAYQHADIQGFLRRITNPAERLARERGEFMDLSGIEFSYVSRETHVCADFY